MIRRLLFAAGAGLFLALAAPAAAQTLPTAAENAELRKWIPASCCVTNNCCFKVEVRDMTPLPDGYYRVVASGQIIRRTEYSQDGNFWRCACDMIEGKWVVHPKAHTRCVFPPLELF